MENNKLTINDIAMQANTSKTTVSFYLNGKFGKMSADTKRRIENVIKETKYSPSIVARSLKSKKSNLIGVVVTDITNPFSSYIVKGIDDVALRENYQILVGSSNFEFKNEKKYIDRMLDMGVDGFIVQPTLKFDKIMNKIQESGKKIVFLDSISSEFNENWVKTNNHDITYEAISKLIDKGYEEFILVSENINLLMARIERKNGFTQALEEKNINYSVVTVPKDITEIELGEILKTKLNIHKRTLIFAINGKVLQLVFKASKIQGWDIPNKVGIIGFDNWDWTFFATPSVSTISQPIYDEGMYAANMIIDMIEDRTNVGNSMVFECEINWSESTNLIKEK